MMGMVITESEDVLFAQHHAFRCARCSRCIKQYEGISAFIFSGILTHELQPLSRIGTIQRHGSKACFGYSERHNHHLFVARHGITHHMLAAWIDYILFTFHLL